MSLTEEEAEEEVGGANWMQNWLRALVVEPEQLEGDVDVSLVAKEAAE